MQTSFTFTQDASSINTFIFDPGGSSTEGNPTYTWDFGDGTPTVTTEQPDRQVHEFPEPGEYTVTLKVTHETKIYDETHRLIITVAPPPVATRFNSAQ